MATHGVKQKPTTDIVFHISDNSDNDNDGYKSDETSDGNIDKTTTWTVKTKKEKRKKSSPSNSPQNANEKRQKGDESISYQTQHQSSENPQQNPDPDPVPNAYNQNPKHHLILFISGKSTNLARQAFSNPIKFKNNLVSQIGQYDAAKIKDDHIILTCSNPKQKAAALNVQQIMDVEVNVSEPRSRTSRLFSTTTRTTRNTEIEKGIIFAVPLEITEEEITNETGAIHARRLTKLNREHGENRITTETVVLSFEHSLPSSTNIGILHFKIKQYIPLPFRCTNCQKFGHGSDQCYRNPSCPRCSGSHSFENCPNKETIKCSNCHGPHSSAWTSCPKYQEIKETIKVSKTTHISFRDALLTVKQQHQKDQQTQLQQEQQQNDHDEEEQQNQEREQEQDNASIPTNQDTERTNSQKHSSARKQQGHPEQENKDLKNSISILQKTLEELITFTNNLQQLLKYCIMGIVLGLDRSSEDSVLKAQVDSFKSLLPQFAAACNLDLSDLPL